MTSTVEHGPAWPEDEVSRSRSRRAARASGRSPQWRSWRNPARSSPTRSWRSSSQTCTCPGMLIWDERKDYTDYAEHDGLQLIS